MLSVVFFNATATTEIYTLSLHDALPIFEIGEAPGIVAPEAELLAQQEVEILVDLLVVLVPVVALDRRDRSADRKSTRLNSSHRCISYAVFCLKKKKKTKKQRKRIIQTQQ